MAKNKDDYDTIISNLLSDEQKLTKMKISTKLLAKKNSTKDICEVVLGKK